MRTQVTVHNSSTKTVSKSTDGKFETKNLRINHSFHCTGAELYNALTQVEVSGPSFCFTRLFRFRNDQGFSFLCCLKLVTAFTCGPVKLDVKPGGVFELFGGNIHGTFVELVNIKINESCIDDVGRKLYAIYSL
jgi:hypothetical protein